MSNTKSKGVPMYKKTSSTHSIDVSCDQDSTESTNDITCIGSLDRYFSIMSSKKDEVTNNNNNKACRTAPTDGGRKRILSNTSAEDDDNKKNTRIKKTSKTGNVEAVFVIE